MKFKYKKFNASFLRPVVPITISVGEKKVNYEVLIDSGADMCIFDAEIGELLGLEIEKGEPHPVSGIVANQTIFYYIHPVIVKVGHCSRKMFVGFSRNIARCGYGIVGQKDFFETFIVKFNLRHQEIELKEFI